MFVAQKRLVVVFLIIIGTAGLGSMGFTDQIEIYYNNQMLTYEDQEPIIKDGRTLIPVRTVESLGFEVAWNGEEKSVVVTNDVNTLKFYLASHYVYSEDQIYVMDVEADLVNGRTMIPLRFLVEGFGKSINYRWVSGKHMIDIYDQQSFGFHKAIVLGPDGQVDGVFNDQIFRSLEVDPEDDQIVVVGTEANGMFKSKDGGDSWSWYREGLLVNAQPGLEYPEFYDISISPDRTSYYAAFASSPGPAEGQYPSAFSGIYVSKNAGMTWERSVSGLKSGTVSAIVAHPLKSHIAYAGVRGGMPSFTMNDFKLQYYNGGIYKTTDYGENWVKVSPEGLADTSDYYRLKTYGEGVVIAMAMNLFDHSVTAGLLYSEDSGLTWKVLNPEGVYFGDFDNYDDKIIYASSDDRGMPKGIYKTSNGGDSWEKTSAMGYGAVRVSPHDPNHVAYSQRNKLYMSYDGLKTSQLVMTYDQTVDKAIITDIVFSKNNSNIIYAGGPGLRIYKSTDKGRNFELVINLRDLIESYRILEDGLWHSHNDNSIEEY